MKREVDPQATSRSAAYALWMKAPNPMVTFFKILNVTNLIRISRKRNLKFNMLLDYCIGKAAVEVKEFYLLPVGEKLVQYDAIAINTIVKNRTGEVSSCDILYTDDLEKFNEDYVKYTAQVAETCQDRDLSDDCMVIGTSAIIDTEIDGAVGMNSGIFSSSHIADAIRRSSRLADTPPASANPLYPSLPRSCSSSRALFVSSRHTARRKLAARSAFGRVSPRCSSVCTVFMKAVFSPLKL